MKREYLRGKMKRYIERHLFGKKFYKVRASYKKEKAVKQMYFFGSKTLSHNQTQARMGEFQ
tara:strand:+ start:472 stop:654 length:183 start_codon:yes stop_codon:yes gene_type:complete